MTGSSSPRKVQLGESEREHLEDVVTEMRERVEANVTYQLSQLGLDDEPAELSAVDDDAQQVVDAIELEAVDGADWDEAVAQYVAGVGYTVVNRLAALRCMEVRGFVDEEVTVFRDDGLTPAAETLVTEEFMLEGEAVLEAYRNACDDLAEELELLFDRATAYSLIDPDEDTFEALCRLLDEVPDPVWRADDVLGWVYEYYNLDVLGSVRERTRSGGIRTSDLGVANQFYTPHWVVRMLTDNALGKLYLEGKGEVEDVVATQAELSARERRTRPASMDDAPEIADFCTYLVPSEETGDPTAFDHPSELRVIDPACGSGHFLLYAFDVLERIWRRETDLDPATIPRRILEQNLYGVDLDMRACQLATFNLYLKARSRARAAGGEDFELPSPGIVCADARIADLDGVDAVFEEVSDGRDDVAETLADVLSAFEEVHGLGSLLDVRGTLDELFDGDDGTQLTFAEDFTADRSLQSVLHSLRDAISAHRDEDSFLAKDLRSFVRLLDVLAQDYDVALMNPPYGSGKRMPETIRQYLEERYRYYPEFYIAFFEACDALVKENGRIGMLVPWTLLFKRSFQEFREDFVGSKGGFDFLAEYGYGILDNATVGTVGTVVRTSAETTSPDMRGEFIRLHDVDRGQKESVFASVVAGAECAVQRYYTVELDEFATVPGTPLTYSTPPEIRSLHESALKLGPDIADIDGERVAEIKTGLQTGNNRRFVRAHWESRGEAFQPFAKGGTDAWMLPEQTTTIDWSEDGKRLARYPNSVIRNDEFYMRDGLTWSYIKRTGRRFGYVPGAVFDVTGSMLFPTEGYSPWLLLCVLNSTVYHGLFLSLTPERDWQIEVVGRIPWHDALTERDDLEAIAKQQYALVASEKASDPRYPGYVGPALVPNPAADQFYDDSGGRTPVEIPDVDRADIDPAWSISEAARAVERRRREQTRELERLSDHADSIVADALGLPDGINDRVKAEIFLRTAEDPADRTVPDPDDVPEPPATLDSDVKRLVHHFAMAAVRAADDGIVPIQETATDQTTILDRVVDRFHDAYGEFADERLIEVDDILGAESATDEAYPNLRAWLAEDFFQYHVETMEKTPIVWRLTTERLVPDAKGVGFACLVDYHGLDSGLFDRLTNRYLEPRNAALRERRSAADRRRRDESLSASERGDAADAADRYASALEQIAVFEDVLHDLSATTPRDIDADHRALAADLASMVASFRDATEKRLGVLDDLRDRQSDEWFADNFSPTFWEQVASERAEWIDALVALERACEAYAKPPEEPVEAHHYDLFEYYDDLVGSTHYASNGILFMAYYYGREGTAFLDADGDPMDGLQDGAATRLAALATGFDEYTALAEGISDHCETLASALPSTWRDRALAEITTQGYHPIPNHGVAINITPLADAEIVPKLVDEDVL
ncbi:BREX-5 system adenine-specific DNA-methyltransferase PglX [Haloplanus halobius]|uniref:BREX-5 system adenine-specific DNA-methyltransferase PglX n=1 Tax=Haloplanus halobius TaxID=2934938 RepID=UPI0020101F07|nr:BREX-5 system adenine-specific DNA-methyltransferase PglX [Haloplanus sp. XH21]